jgi:hypothetical protein
MSAGLNDEVVSNVLTYLRGNPDWFDLYKAYEAMTNDTGRNPARSDCALGSCHIDPVNGTGVAQLEMLERRQRG